MTPRNAGHEREVNEPRESLPVAEIDEFLQSRRNLLAHLERYGAIESCDDPQADIRREVIVRFFRARKSYQEAGRAYLAYLEACCE